MQNKGIDRILSEWSEEFNESLGKSNALCVALFGADKKLLFATPVMDKLFKGEPYKSFINPTFDQLLEIKSAGSLIFEGLLTIGNYTSINSSIVAHVFLKEGRMLVVGGADTVQLLDQYSAMHHLNHQINNLQRQLLKEKSTLENTLNQLNETNSKLQQINAAKDKFFSIIAHDLKSPFNSIIGFSEILVEQVQENNLNGIEKYAGFILQSSNRAMALLTNLMEWAQSQTGRMEFNPEHFEMEAFINEATLLMDDIARQKSINIKKVLPRNVYMFADKAMINTVFRNLISNAIKFTIPGGKITISAEVKQREIVFLVSDTGIGIPKNRIEKIFRIEQSYSTPGTNKEKGTGLGLILCREFVEKHGGKIWVESEEGIGSIFYFTLPCIAEPQEKGTV
jgi:signal transduction histidine kinase